MGAEALGRYFSRLKCKHGDVQSFAFRYQFPPTVYWGRLGGVSMWNIEIVPVFGTQSGMGTCGVQGEVCGSCLPCVIMWSGESRALLRQDRISLHL